MTDRAAGPHVRCMMSGMTHRLEIGPRPSLRQDGSNGEEAPYLAARHDGPSDSDAG